MKKKIVALKHVSGVELTCMLLGELSITIDKKIFLSHFLTPQLENKENSFVLLFLTISAQVVPPYAFYRNNLTRSTSVRLQPYCVIVDHFYILAIKCEVG